MNSKIAALKIYDFLRDHPDRLFKIKNFCGIYGADDVVPGFGESNEFTYKIVRSAFNLIEKAGLISRVKGDYNSYLYQYSSQIKEEDTQVDKLVGLIYAINKKQFERLLNRYKDTIDEPHLGESVEQSRMMSAADEFIKIAESQRIDIDSFMADNLIQMIEDNNARYWSEVFLYDENEERMEKPIEISVVRVFLQSGGFHCHGIIKTDDGITGDKFSLEDVHSVSRGGMLAKNQEYKELQKCLCKLAELPGFFAEKSFDNHPEP